MPFVVRTNTRRSNARAQLRWLLTWFRVLSCVPLSFYRSYCRTRRENQVRHRAGDQDADRPRRPQDPHPRGAWRACFPMLAALAITSFTTAVRLCRFFLSACAYPSFHGVCSLQSFSNIKIARDAVCSLIMGAPPGKVYNHMRQVAGRLRERF